MALIVLTSCFFFASEHIRLLAMPSPLFGFFRTVAHWQIQVRARKLHFGLITCRSSCHIWHFEPRIHQKVYCHERECNKQLYRGCMVLRSPDAIVSHIAFVFRSWEDNVATKSNRQNSSKVKLTRIHAAAVHEADPRALQAKSEKQPTHPDVYHAVRLRFDGAQLSRRVEGTKEYILACHCSLMTSLCAFNAVSTTFADGNFCWRCAMVATACLIARAASKLSSQIARFFACSSSALSSAKNAGTMSCRTELFDINGDRDAWRSLLIKLS